MLTGGAENIADIVKQADELYSKVQQTSGLAVNNLNNGPVWVREL